MSSSEHQAEGAALASIELHLIGTHGVVHFQSCAGSLAERDDLDPQPIEDLCMSPEGRPGISDRHPVRRDHGGIQDPLSHCRLEQPIADVAARTAPDRNADPSQIPMHFESHPHRTVYF